MPGLPFQSLPAAQTAESIFQEQFEEQKRQLQEQFDLAWNTIRGRAGTTLRPVQANEMLAELHAKGQAAALELKQKHQSQMGAFKRIDAMVSQGLLTNGEEAKLDMVLDPEVRKYQPKSQDVETRFKGLESLKHILEQDLIPFKLEPGPTTEKKWRSPFVTPSKPWGPATMRGPAFLRWPQYTEEIESPTSKLFISERPEYVWNDTTGSYILRRTEPMREATNEEIDRYEATMALLQEVYAKKTKLASQIDLAGSMQKAGLRKMGGGAFDQKITTSMQDRLTPGEVAEGWTGYGPSFREQPTTTAPQAAPTTADKVYKKGDTRTIKGVTYTFDGEVWRS